MRRNYSIMGGRMDATRIAELLRPFTTDVPPSPQILGQLQLYLDLLLLWNARINLTAVRSPEQIVVRHFGESLFAAQTLLPKRNDTTKTKTLADVGSGAGFPGIPMKLFAPEPELTVIESQNKKATFLREVIRTLKLDCAEVFCGRAEQWTKSADLVTLRAVEQFERALAVAADLVTPGGRLCLLVGEGQVATARPALGTSWIWQEPIAVPQSSGRVVLVGMRDRLYSALPEADR
jgi:16S rRNA (guanine527-N7)-methyltransferase